MQDVEAANRVFASSAEIWQIPKGAYTKVSVSFAELMEKIRPCGAIGRYLVDNTLRFYEEVVLGTNSSPKHRDGRILGDSSTVSVLAVEGGEESYHMGRAPKFLPDYSYEENPTGAPIRICHRVHERFIIEDLAAKLRMFTKTES